MKYVNIEKVDLLLGDDAWHCLSEEEKTRNINRAEAQLEQLEFLGEKVSSSQDNEFPRDFYHSRGYYISSSIDYNPTYNEEEYQLKKIEKAVVAQIRFMLYQQPSGMVSFSDGRGSVNPRLEDFCREAKGCIREFLR